MREGCPPLVLSWFSLAVRWLLVLPVLVSNLDLESALEFIVLLSIKEIKTDSLNTLVHLAAHLVLREFKQDSLCLPAFRYSVQTYEIGFRLECVYSESSAYRKGRSKGSTLGKGIQFSQNKRGNNATN